MVCHWVIANKAVGTTTKIVNSNVGTIRFASCERIFLVLFTMVAKSYPRPGVARQREFCR